MKLGSKGGDAEACLSGVHAHSSVTSRFFLISLFS